MLLNATIRNVRRAFREVNTFEAEGDVRPAVRAAMKEVLETALQGELTAPCLTWGRVGRSIRIDLII
jgi:hypothetical protein